MLLTPHSERVVVRPAVANGTGVLVLAGSSDRVDHQRAAVLATTGALAMSIRWMGAQGTPTERPLELFIDAVDELRGDCDRVVLLGTSFGAEAALLTASLDERVDAVAAFAPTPFVWPGFRPDSAREISHWTWHGQPLAWISFDPGWSAKTTPPAYQSMYRSSVHRATRIAPDSVLAATIPVERIRGEVLLVAGGDDQVWPSLAFARLITARREVVGLPTTLVAAPDAGHRTILPGEDVVTEGQDMARGGCPAADRALGAQCWPHLTRLLNPGGCISAGRAGYSSSG